MTPHPENINQLLEKLDDLLKRQDEFSREIQTLRKEIDHLRSSVPETPLAPTPKIETISTEAEFVPPISGPSREQAPDTPLPYIAPASPAPLKAKSDIEKFVGENLINKIGIAITVIGVGIGAKYSIEHELISPLARIVLGYLAGLLLLGVGLQLKKNYENYSAVLVSGAIAILYFITFAAYSFYALLPQMVAFALMVIFTVFTVMAAIRYDRQVIAHIGLVGAYAIPILLNEGQGNAGILFAYIAILNAGILVIAFRKYWKPLYYAAFILTWIIFLSWFNTSYQEGLHFNLALVFLTIYFLTFYAIFLAYKLLKHERFEIEDIILLLANSFLFYGTGYAILDTHAVGSEALGLFTLANAMLHGVAAILIFRQTLADRHLFFFIAGLALVFMTISIPVQLDGNWVTLLWAAEAAVLFWVGRTKNAPVYERLSYFLVFLAFFSLVHDWMTAYPLFDPLQTGERRTPLLHIQFLTTILCAIFFGWFVYILSDKRYPSMGMPRGFLKDIIVYGVPAILLITLYYAFRMEISTYWNQTYADLVTVMRRESPDQYDTSPYKSIIFLKTLWIIIYTMLFFTMLSWINITKIKNRSVGLVNLVLNTFVILVFLVQGFYYLILLKDNNLLYGSEDLQVPGASGHMLRYISIFLIGTMLVLNHIYRKKDFMQPLPAVLRITMDLMMHLTIVWIVSSEVMTWMDRLGSSHSTKLGLSIFWGIYALLLIALGIRQNQKHLRIGAIVLFGITLLKLFIYDISHLETLAKTVIFVSLGLLLLIISFLYHKYKNLIHDEHDHPDSHHSLQK